MSYEIAVINPRKRRRSGKRPSKAQLAARRKFVARFGKKKRVKSRRRKAAHKSTNAGVTLMAKRKRRTKARKSKSHAVRRRRRSSGKRHAATGYTVGSRPIRRRKLNPRGSRRRRYRRNPLGLPSLGGFTSQLVPAALGAAGGMALNIGLSFLPLPDALKTGFARHGVRLAGAFGLGMIAKKFLGSKGNAVALGAMTIVLYDIGKEVLQKATPELGARLGEYEDVSLSGDLDGDDGFYDPAPVIQDGAGAYLDGPDEQGDADEMGAYMEGNLDGVYG